jgi:hypothetical protein
MDPDACLALVHEHLDALRDGDEDARDEAIEALRNLADWLQKGGFAPRTFYVPAE